MLRCIDALPIAVIGSPRKGCWQNGCAASRDGAAANVVISTPIYVRFATHYGFAPDFCHVNDPQSRSIVENLVGYTQLDLAAPSFPEAAVAGTAIDSPAVNAAAHTWCAEANAWIPSGICAIPDDRLLDEPRTVAPVAISTVADRPAAASDPHSGPVLVCAVRFRPAIGRSRVISSASPSV